MMYGDPEKFSYREGCYSPWDWYWDEFSYGGFLFYRTCDGYHNDSGYLINGYCGKIVANNELIFVCTDCAKTLPQKLKFDEQFKLPPKIQKN